MSQLCASPTFCFLYTRCVLDAFSFDGLINRGAVIMLRRAPSLVSEFDIKQVLFGLVLRSGSCPRDILARSSLWTTATTVCELLLIEVRVNLDYYWQTDSH